jgi:hypothetical protein
MDRRAKFREGLHPMYVPLYDELCQMLPEEWQPYYGYRSFKEQDGLYAIGRTAPGTRVTNAKGGLSAHNWGCATDWTLWQGKQPLWPTAQSKLWLPYMQACEKLGLIWGGGFRSPDAVHNELALSVSWRRIFEEYEQGGLKAAEEAIRKFRVTR